MKILDLLHIVLYGSNSYRTNLLKFQILDEPGAGRAFPYKLYHSTHRTAIDASSVDREEENNLGSLNEYKSSDYKYENYRQRKWRRVGQRVDRTFDVLFGAFQSDAVQVSKYLQHFVSFRLKFKMNF